MIKPTKWPVCPTKTQISLGIHPVWSESSLSAWRSIVSLATHWVHKEKWSDWVDALADLSLRLVHPLFCWFCHAPDQYLSCDMTKPTKWVGAQWRLRSAWASAQTDQSSLSARRKLVSLATHWAQSKAWSDWVDAHVDLSLRWAHTHFVGFVMLWLIFRTVTGSIWLQDKTAPWKNYRSWCILHVQVILGSSHWTFVDHESYGRSKKYG